MFPYPWPAFVPTVAAILSDGKPHTREELLTRVARAHALTQDHLSQTMINGQNVFASRVDFPLGRLVTKKAVAKLSQNHGSNSYQLTEHGLDVLRRKGKQVKISDF